MKQKMKRKRSNQAFSLMETLIWTGIVGIFAGIMVASAIQVWDNAKVRAAKAEMQTLSALLLDYFETEGTFPEKLEVLLTEGYVEEKEGQGDKFLDPWSKEYAYSTDSDKTGFTLKSYGSDRKESGENAKGTKKDLVVSHGMKNEDGQ